MALFPVYGHFEGDFVPHLVPIDTENTMAEVSAAVAHHSVGRRIAPNPGATGFEAEIGGKVVAQDRKFEDVMGELGVQPLDFVKVRFAA